MPTAAALLSCGGSTLPLSPSTSSLYIGWPTSSCQHTAHYTQMNKEPNTQHATRHDFQTSSLAIAERLRCSVGQLWPKYEYCFPYSKNIAVAVMPVNRQWLKCHRMQRRHANGWFTSWTKFAFKGMSPPTICARTDRPVKALYKQSNFVANFLIAVSYTHLTLPTKRIV